jgi:hypothetical protein
MIGFTGWKHYQQWRDVFFYPPIAYGTKASDLSHRAVRRPLGRITTSRHWLMLKGGRDHPNRGN